MPRILLCCAGSIALMVGRVAPPSALAADDPSAALRAIAPHQCAPALEDYTFMWWAYGWRGRSPEGARVLAFQTGRFGLALDVDRAKLLCLGPIAKPKPYDVAASDPNDVVLKLPAAELAIEIQNGGRVYRAVRARFPSRIIESGRFFQRCDLHDLRFADDQNRELAMAGRLEIAVWPDRVAFGVQVTPQEPLADATIRLALNAKGVPSRADLQALVSGKRYEVQWTPDPPSESTDNDMVRVVPEAGHAGSSVSYDPFYGWHRIDVSPPSSPPESLLPGDTPAERLRVRLRNDTDRPRSIRLLFAKESGSWSITGMSPMLLDGAGRPTGIPVQISKNWHRKEERLLYEGPWFHGLTLLRLAPRSQTECQFVLAYARWGGLPAASHAQLCLVGWGVDQLWDQAAIGSWGESICYDPDVNLNRAMIDDIRPLMVWGMNQKQVKWTWTNNVGGGDFLVYFDAQGQKQYLSRMRTAYTAQCPNLTEVTYAGQSPDGNLAARITVSTPAVDDYNRAFHRVRYDVLRKTAFRRLAFYQLGADQYNDAPVRLLARGNAAGLVESWEPGPDLRRDAGYVRTAIACEGRTPWFSLHHARRHDDKGGAWANRGLVLRRWNARLGGRDAPIPYAAIYRTQGQMGNVLVEIVPPPEVKELLPGDFVEAEVHLLVLPMAADDYYGPNEGLRAALARDADTWKMVHREAVGNDLAIQATKGTIQRAYPIALVATGDEQAEFSVTGGLGYVPITIFGLKCPHGWQLLQSSRGAWMPVARNDFPQADYDPSTATWRLTWNVSLDRPGDSAGAATCFKIAKTTRPGRNPR